MQRRFLREDTSRLKTCSTTHHKGCTFSLMMSIVNAIHLLLKCKGTSDFRKNLPVIFINFLISTTYVTIMGSPHPQHFISHKMSVGKPTYNLNLQTSRLTGVAWILGVFCYFVEVC